MKRAFGLFLLGELYVKKWLWILIKIGGLKVITNGYIGMIIGITYRDDSVIADGDFLVYFDDVKLEFTTAPPSN